jgi:hypothetical protein
MTDDGMLHSVSSSSKDCDGVLASGEVKEGFDKGEGDAEGCGAPSADTIDCETSDSSIDARLWFLAKLGLRWSSSHFFSTLPIHDDTTGDANDPRPGIDEAGGKAVPFKLARLDRFEDSSEVGSSSPMMDLCTDACKASSSISRDFRRCIFEPFAPQPEDSTSVS